MGGKSLMGILVFAAMALAAVYAYNYLTTDAAKPGVGGVSNLGVRTKAA